MELGNKLYDRYYSKDMVYEMLWNQVDLSADLVVGAPFGGPIAVVRDERKVQIASNVLADGGRGDMRMRVFSSAGKLLSSFTWNNRGLVAMSWNADEQLVCVTYTGQVIVYSIHGHRVSSFELGPACREDKVAECMFWDTGLVVRTGGLSELYAVTDYSDPVPFKLRDAGLTKPPTSMAVIAPEFNGTMYPEVLLATAAGSIVVVDRKESQDMRVENAKGPFAKMVVSPDGTKIACFSDDGTLYVMTTDFTKNLSESRLKSPTPKDIVWCGDDSLILYWEKVLLLIGFLGNYVRYPYEGALKLVGEVDGVRIITEQHCEFLRQLPNTTVSIFDEHSEEPGALLFRAYNAYEAKQVTADALLTRLDEEYTMNDAIDTCIDASMHELHSLSLQRKLLKAAYFGKLFSDDYKKNWHTEQAKILRVLNAVRNYEIGIPLTLAQFHQLEADVVIARLVNRHNHLLALRISEYLHISPSRVLVHWACAKIRAADEEDEASLADTLIRKLTAYPSVSFGEVAATAFGTGRRVLATKLLEYEPLASKQVPSLLSMKEDELALTKAIDSGDTDLVYMVLLHAEKTRELKELAKLIQNKPMARHLFVAHSKQRNLNSLIDYYYLMQQRVEAANAAVLLGYRSPEFKARHKLFGTAQHFFDLSKTASFNAKATEEQMLLMKVQEKIALDLNDPSILDASVSDIIVKFLTQTPPNLSEATKLQKQFKVPDRRFWHLRVRTMARTNVDGLLELAKQNPVIGIHPFIEACQEYGYDEEAIIYIKMIKHPLERMEFLCNAGCWEDAAKVAVGERNRDALEMIKAKCRMPSVIQFIDQQIQSGAV